MNFEISSVKGATVTYKLEIFFQVKLNKIRYYFL